MTGFDRGAIALLDELPGWTAERFASEKARLTSGLLAPARTLIAEVAEQLPTELTVTSRGSVSPLHTDLRFASPGAPRYKDHLLMTTWGGTDKASAPVLWIRVDAHRVGLASGMNLAPPFRDRWRAAVGDERGTALGDALDVLVAERGAEIAGDSLRTVPKPFGADHPRADLLRRTGFQVRFVEPLPTCVAESAFVDWCVERLDALIPVHRWLRDHIAQV